MFQYLTLNVFKAAHRPASGSARPHVKRQQEKAAEASKGLPISYALLGANVILYSAGITHALGHGIDAAQGWFGASPSVMHCSCLQCDTILRGILHAA